MDSKILTNRFYQGKTLKVAQDLLGCFLVRKIGKKIIRGVIAEMEAYVGEDDLACHASKGRTPRTEIMYGEAGHAYVYMIYGMYHCLNIVTEKKEFPAAVLIRGIANLSESRTNSTEWKEIKNVNLNGPGKLCKFLKINKKLNCWDLTKGKKLWIEKPARNFPKKNIVAGKRIGIDYAQHCKDYRWRFLLENKSSW